MSELVFEHEPFVGKNYDCGDRLCVVGYSHYTAENEADRPSLTNDVMKKVLGCDFGDTAFWQAIAGYCRNSPALSANEVSDFWNSVLFFNFLPQAVGTKMFASGRKSQVKAARLRFLRILREHQPSRVLVFSSKAFEALPQMEQEAGARHLKESGGNQWGTYAGISAPVIGLRHPLFAPAEETRMRVGAALATAP